MMLLFKRELSMTGVSVMSGANFGAGVIFRSGVLTDPRIQQALLIRIVSEPENDKAIRDRGVSYNRGWCSVALPAPSNW